MSAEQTTPTGAPAAPAFDEAAAEAQAIAILNGVEDAAPAAPPEPQAAPAAAPAAEPVKPAADDDWKSVMGRITRLEASRDELEERAARAERERDAEREDAAKFRALREKVALDPTAAFNEFGVPQADVLDAVMHGKKVDPKMVALEKRLAAFEEREAKRAAAEREAEQAVARGRAESDLVKNLPGEVVSKMADKAPTLVAIFKDDLPGLGAEIVDQLKLAVARGEGRTFTASDAVVALEKKYARVRGSAAPAQSVAAAPATKTLTNVAPAQAAPAKNERDITDAERKAAAIAILNEI